MAQKSKAEYEARRALHEAGVAKKKEIMAKSVVAEAARKVYLNLLNNIKENGKHLI